jgi:UDP-2,3-diacylglucosamine pyrophosphatase LpxH
MRRVIILSDLHVGGGNVPMLGHPELLTDFLSQLAEHPERRDVELVVAGDFIDFLAEEPIQAWTPTEAGAEEKIRAVFARSPDLFDAFGRCARDLGRFTILLGNHDIELAYPRVRDALLRRLGTDPHRCHFIAGNEAYRIGELLIEHGNRYDPWNAIDHHGLRQIASAASRGEVAPRDFAVCPGSLLVHGAMTPLKARYHFIDLLKPEGKILALLLLEIEPSVVKRHLKEVFRFASAWVRKWYQKARWFAEEGAAPNNERLVAANEEDDDLPMEIRRVFYRELEELEGQRERPVAAGDVLDMMATVALGQERDGLRAIFERGEDVPADRLRKIQVALGGVADRVTVFEERYVGGDCYGAAKRMVEAGTAKVVVMGHTHLGRVNDLPGGGRYLNTGTWADLIKVDDALLEDSDAGRTALKQWLRRLATDDLEGVRVCCPSYGDVVVSEDGRVDMGRAKLGWHRAGTRFE